MCVCVCVCVCVRVEGGSTVGWGDAGPAGVERRGFGGSRGRERERVFNKEGGGGGMKN